MRRTLVVLTALLAVLAGGCGQHAVHPVTVGPGWAKVLSVAGRLPPSKARPPVSRVSPGFHIEGGTVRAVGVITSDSPNDIGLSLFLQQKHEATTHWVDATGATMAPNGQQSRPSGTSVAFDWATTAPLKSGEYRLVISASDVGEKYVVTMYVKK